jgi:hypothetical protein
MRKQKLHTLLEAKKDNIKAKCIHREKDSCLAARTHTRLIAVYLGTLRARNDCASPHGGAENRSVVRAIS